MNSPSTKTYSAFWPLLILIVGFISIQIVYLKNSYSQRAQLRDSVAGMAAAVSQAATVEKTLENVGRDLNELASKNAEAAKIVQEFQIWINPPAPAH